MDIIFLDIDYVLNGSQTKEHIGSIKGIDQKLLRLFAPLAHRPNTEIVLTSTWRLYWDKSLKNDPVKTWAGRSKKRYGRYMARKAAAMFSEEDAKAGSPDLETVVEEEKLRDE